MTELLWQPSQKTIRQANLTHFARQAIREWKLRINTYPEFYRWSVDRPEQFWQSMWKYGGVVASARGGSAVRPKR